jgi:hypothetical protein
MSSIVNGDRFKVSFAGAGSQEGAIYEVYHITGQAKNTPSNQNDQLVFLKLTSRSFFQSGAAFTLSVPAKNIDDFFVQTFK